jgi:hypothetical protein
MHRPQSQPPDRKWLDRARARIQRVLAQPEPTIEHLRNALTILRFSIEHDEPMIGNGTPGVVVPITSLARIQARLEAAIAQLAPAADTMCLACGGTILRPTIDGVPRGTCHCAHAPERVTDWNECTIRPNDNE